MLKTHLLFSYRPTFTYTILIPLGVYIWEFFFILVVKNWTLVEVFWMTLAMYVKQKSQYNNFSTLEIKLTTKNTYSTFKRSYLVRFPIPERKKHSFYEGNKPLQSNKLIRPQISTVLWTWKRDITK